jgi:hypothetical protein
MATGGQSPEIYFTAVDPLGQTVQVTKWRWAHAIKGHQRCSDKSKWSRIQSKIPKPSMKVTLLTIGYLRAIGFLDRALFTEVCTRLLW